MGQGIITHRGLDTSDATATAAKILSGFTAYAGGLKLTGTAQDVVIATKVISGTPNNLTIPDIIGKNNLMFFLSPASPSPTYFTAAYPLGFVYTPSIKKLWREISNGVECVTAENSLVNFSTGNVLPKANSDTGFFKDLCTYIFIAW